MCPALFLRLQFELKKAVDTRTIGCAVAAARSSQLLSPPSFPTFFQPYLPLLRPFALFFLPASTTATTATTAATAATTSITTNGNSISLSSSYTAWLLESTSDSSGVAALPRSLSTLQLNIIMSPVKQSPTPSLYARLVARPLFVPRLSLSPFSCLFFPPWLGSFYVFFLASLYLGSFIRRWCLSTRGSRSFVFVSIGFPRRFPSCFPATRTTTRTIAGPAPSDVESDITYARLKPQRATSPRPSLFLLQFLLVPRAPVPRLRDRPSARPCPPPPPTLLTSAFEENDPASEYHRDASEPAERLALFNLTARRSVPLSDSPERQRY